MRMFPRVTTLLFVLLLGTSLEVKAELKQVTYTGTGFVIHADGYLLTCAHLIDNGDAEKITVTLGGKSFQASVLDYDMARDIALLQIQAQKLPALPLANSNAVRLGEEIRAVGYPLQRAAGEGIKMTRGSIAGMTTIRTQKTFQIDAPINVGNSGGPILNERGEVVGIVNAKLTAPGIEGVAFAVPINYARSMLRNEFIEPLTLENGEKLDGPTLAERATPAVAFISVETTEWDFTDKEGRPYVPDVLRAKRFELMDDAGKIRGVFSLYNDGSLGLALGDAAGQVRGSFLLGSDGRPHLRLNGAKGEARGYFALDKDEAPELTLYDAAGRMRGTFMLLSNGDVPSLTLYDAAGKPRGFFTLLSNGDPRLWFYNLGGRLIWGAP